MNILRSIVDWFIDNIELELTLDGGAIIVAFRRRHEAAAIIFEKNGKDITMLEMTDTQQATLTLTIKDAKGRPAKVDGIPAWSSADEAVAKVANVSTDGMSADVLAVGTGLTQVRVDTDADLGAGVKPLTGFLDVTITGGEAVVIELVPGPVTEQP